MFDNLFWLLGPVGTFAVIACAALVLLLGLVAPPCPSRLAS
jgi:hypothetical protein